MLMIVDWGMVMDYGYFLEKEIEVRLKFEKVC